MYNNTMNISPQTIQAMTGDQRYNLITKLINAEIDDLVSEDFESSGYDNVEQYRDERMAQFCEFLKTDLCSDNYNG